MVTPRKLNGVEWVFISDVHVGRKTERYDSKRFLNSVEVLMRELRDARAFANRMRISLKKRYVCFLGDIVDGEGIYPAQAYEQELGINEQIELAVKGFSKIISKADDIIAVPGNHGRASREGTGNWDMMFYYVLRERHSEKNFVISSRNKLRYRDGEWSFYFSHPSHIRMYQNIPFYGVVQDIMREYVRGGRIDIAVFGHFHVVYKYEFNGVRIYGNGTFLPDDEFTFRKSLRPSLGMWYLVLGCDGSKNILFEREMRLDRREWHV